MKDRLREALDDKGMLAAELARLVGVSRATVTDWLNGNTQQLKGINLTRVANCLGVIPRWLAEGKPPKHPPTDHGVAELGESYGAHRRVAIVSFVQAGEFTSALEPYALGTGDGDVVIDTAMHPIGPRAFALRVRGDSMLEEYVAGEVIVIDPDTEPHLREPVVAKRDEDDEATFKLYVPRGHDEEGFPIIELVPINPHFKTLIINQEHPGRIIGPMVTRIQGRRRH